MIKVQELRNYFDQKPVWELDRTFYMSKPRLHQYDGIWYIVGDSDYKFLDYPVPAISLYQKREHWLPLLRYRFPVKILHTDYKGNKKGQAYYIRYIFNINGVIYPEWWILNHISEVQAELSDVCTEDLLQEI
jgi:hypothetical protein